MEDAIINTCTGWTFEDDFSTETSRAAICSKDYNMWECGFKSFEPSENTSPAFAVNQFRAIARALVQTDFTLPECTFNENRYCEAEIKEQRVQRTYTLAEKSTVCVDSSHET
eukprot:UN07461